MKKLSSFVLAALLFVSTLLFVSPNAIAANNLWQAYVDQQILGVGLSQGAIIGQDGTILANSPGFSPKDSELKTLVGLFNNPANVFSNGITLAGKKYIGVKADQKSIYGKIGVTGVVAVKTAQAVVIGIYSEGFNPGDAANIVEALGDYLIENGS